MAQFAANFTNTYQNKPSILEIIAQESLNDILIPALQKLSQATIPQKFSWYHKNTDKILAIFNGCLQYYYLKYYDSTFSENFYHLKRMTLDDKNLSETYKIICAVQLAVLSYLKIKFLEKFNAWRNDSIDGCLSNTSIDILKKIFIKFYPIFQVSWYGFLLSNYLAYLSNQHHSQLPSLWMLNLKLVYSDERMQELNILMRLLEVVAFLMQFLQAIKGYVPNFNVEALPKISTPIPDNKSSNFKEKCPICRQYWKLPTVLPVSGYVFCFTCLLKHLKAEENCPVTKLPATPSSIIRLFE